MRMSPDKRAESYHRDVRMLRLETDALIKNIVNPTLERERNEPRYDLGVSIDDELLSFLFWYEKQDIDLTEEELKDLFELKYKQLLILYLELTKDLEKSNKRVESLEKLVKSFEDSRGRVG